ncbi:MAG: hypothetical protein WDM96_10945 [Lacunisphaera sp.]
MVLHRLADRVGVLAVEAVEAGVGLDGVAAAEHLMDEHRGVGEERVLVAGRNLRRVDVAGQGALAVVGHGIRSEWEVAHETREMSRNPNLTSFVPFRVFRGLKIIF